MNGMKLACDMLEMPVTLVDTKGTASNQKYLVEVAAKLAHEGKSPEEIKDILEKLVEDSATIIMVPNLEHLKKGRTYYSCCCSVSRTFKNCTNYEIKL